MSPPIHEIAMTNPDAWGGAWIRSRSGPTTRAIIRGVSVSIWHRVGNAGTRIRTACGYGPREGFLWPSGGIRMEIARPGPYASLPGEVCPRCLQNPVIGYGDEVEVLESELDDLADRVASRLIERADARKELPE